MYFYQVDDTLAVSFLPDLPFPGAAEGRPALFLTQRNPLHARATWRVTEGRQLAEEESVLWLDSASSSPEALPRELIAAMEAGTLTGVNLSHPRWREALRFTAPRSGKKRVHLLAVGDVGSALLTALKLMGGNDISHIGICDLNPKVVERWVTEAGQMEWPWDYGTLPEVESVSGDRLFDCDVFIFAATKAIPAVDSGVQDVRMAQLDANRRLVESFARQARNAKFRGLFMVMSDPVDPLCKAAWLASNRNETGAWDGLGLLPEQVQGFGLGVMNARAAYYAKRDDRFAAFLSEGRSFGPHGRGLVIANSIQHYDDALSRELTHLTETANLRVRELGFKPYAAPAVSSGALQLLLTLRGEWHCSSVPLGSVWFGVRNRFTPFGLETEALPLPEALLARLRETEAQLAAIL